MNQTHEPSAADEQQDTPTTAPQPGVDREHLRSYVQLRRSVTDRKIAGVAGGLGRHLNIDPTILRVLFVVLCFFGGAGLVLYGAAWLLVPEDGQESGTIATSPNTRNALLIGAGVLAALLLVGDSWGGIGFPWPVFLAGVGVLLYLVLRDRGQTPLPGQPGQPPVPTYAASSPLAFDAPSTAPSTSTSVGQPPAPPWQPQTQAAPAYQVPPRPYRGPKLFGFTVALIAIALGSLGLYDVSGGSVTDAAYPALALAVTGLMLVVGAFVGRAGGLIFLGLVSAVALAVTAAVGTFSGWDLGNGREVAVAPASASSVRSHYDITSGQLSVNLGDVTDPQALDGRTIEVSARAGELLVVLPHGVRSDVTAGIDGPGQIDLPDRGSGGINTNLAGVYGDGDATVTIVTHLSAGHIDVRNP